MISTIDSGLRIRMSVVRIHFNGTWQFQQLMPWPPTLLISWQGSARRCHGMPRSVLPRRNIFARIGRMTDLICLVIPYP